MNSTATTGPEESFNLKDFTRLEMMIARMPKVPWCLIAPDGRLWMADDPNDLLPMLAGAAASVWLKKNS